MKQQLALKDPGTHKILWKVCTYDKDKRSEVYTILFEKKKKDRKKIALPRNAEFVEAVIVIRTMAVGICRNRMINKIRRRSRVFRLRLAPSGRRDRGHPQPYTNTRPPSRPYSSKACGAPPIFARVEPYYFQGRSCTRSCSSSSRTSDSITWRSPSFQTNYGGQAPPARHRHGDRRAHARHREST